MGNSLGPAIMMPGTEEMFEALRGVLDEPHACEQLYPLVCKQLAGQERMATGVVLGITLAVHDYLEGLPPMMGPIITIMVPAFITAITPEEIRADTLEFWENTRQA